MGETRWEERLQDRDYDSAQAEIAEYGPELEVHCEALAQSKSSIVISRTPKPGAPEHIRT
jgi:hypothetical protein